ncbi:MAG: Os1348 family NHLP clan protein [Chloroflexota bacterium]
MASKNLGAVIQRAISDGAFRRQLQSDPAAALRGFNLTADEVAAIRSGDSSKLMSLGVDQRMSKAFSLGGAGTQATRSAMSGDVSGNTSNALVGDNTSGAREGIVGDPTSGARSAISTGQQDSYRAINDPDNTGGTRETVSDPTAAGTRSAISTGQEDSYRAINDPDNTGGARETVSSGQEDSYRAINDPDNTGGTRETVSSDTQSTFRAVNDLDTPSSLQGAEATSGDSAGGDASIAADDNYSVASRMHEATADLSLPASSDIQQDPGFVDSHSAFIPSDSADVQRELQDSHGDAIGNTGNTGIDS